MFSRLISAYVQHGPTRGKARIVKWLMPFAGRTPIRSRYGVYVTPYKGDLTNVWSISGGVYDDVFSALSILKEGMCFLDIGANVGVFSMVAAQRVGRDGMVVAFEPSPVIFQRLVANAAANRVPNFVGFQLALAADTGIVRFQAGDANHTGTGHLSDTGDITVLQVGYGHLQPLLDPLIAGRRVVIKIDVEGAECLVVRSLEPLLRSGLVNAAIVEIDHLYLARFDTTASEIYELLAQAGLTPTSGNSLETDHFNEVFLRD